MSKRNDKTIYIYKYNNKSYVLYDNLKELLEENKLLKETKLVNQFPDTHCIQVKINTYKDRIDKAIEYIGNGNLGITRKTREKFIKILKGSEE